MGRFDWGWRGLGVFVWMTLAWTRWLGITRLHIFRQDINTNFSHLLNNINNHGGDGEKSESIPGPWPFTMLTRTSPQSFEQKVTTANR